MPTESINVPFTFDLSQVPHPAALVDALFWQRARPYPETRMTSLPGRGDPRGALPEDARIVHCLETDGMTGVIAEGAGFVLRLRSREDGLSVYVAASDQPLVARLIASVASTLSPPPPDTTVAVNLWRSDRGATRWVRHLDVPAWTEIAENYPASVRTDLEALMSRRSSQTGGHLMVWTGPPGTGKTHAIRALMDSWSSWCGIHLVIDPERFFDDAAYLLDVLAEAHTQRTHCTADSSTPIERTLVICEDADDFIRARHHTGAALSRLLNLGDGLFGQGLSTTVLLTSNTPIAELDPALLRPGRLLARLNFPHFTADEARAWLRDPRASIPAEGLSLAELYERSGHTRRHGTFHEPVRATGAYL